MHDRSSPFVIAQLEQDLGIDADAVANLRARSTSLVEAFSNPALIDCGRARCRNRSQEVP